MKLEYFEGDYMKKKYIIILTIICITLCFMIYAYYENTSLQVTNYEITSEEIPIDFNNYKIVQISDYHNAKSKKLNNELISKIKKEKPDIIVITGDLVDAYKTDIETSIKLIKSIKDISPIYYVTGNHEEKIDNYSKLKESLEELKVRILNNETESIKKNGYKINLIGINDPTNETICEIELKESSYDAKSYNILLSHRPELLDVYGKNDIDLVLTGHAHGGQIRIPFVGGLVAPNQGVFPKYTSGIYQKDTTTMIVSRGIGNSIIPFRINNNPELVVITLKNYG